METSRLLNQEKQKCLTITMAIIVVKDEKETRQTIH